MFVRRTLLATVATTLTLMMVPAHAQQTVLKVHHFLPATSNIHVNLIQAWCDKIAKESSDKLKCQIHPAMTLGGTPAQLIDQAKDGVVDIVWTLPTYSAGRFTKSEVFELPFLTRSAKGSSLAFWHYVQKNAQDEYKGVKPLWLHTNDGSSFHWAKSSPITKIEDLKGMKVRAATRLNSRFLASLGATPVQMPLPAVPDAMSKGVIDGAMIPWEGIPTIKLHEIAKSHTNVGAGQGKFANSIFAFLMNQSKYDSLPSDLKKVIDANSGPVVSSWAGEKGFDSVVERNQKMATDRGNSLTSLPEAELSKWIKASDEVDDQWIKEISAKGADGKALLQDARSLIQQYDK